MSRYDRIWLRLERESTGSWLEIWLRIDKEYPREYLGHEVDRLCKELYPGWDWLSYCVPEFQGADGRPLDFDELVDGGGHGLVNDL